MRGLAENFVRPVFEGNREGHATEILIFVCAVLERDRTHAIDGITVIRGSNESPRGCGLGWSSRSRCARARGSPVLFYSLDLLL